MNHRHSRRLSRVPIAASAIGNIRTPRGVSAAPSLDIGPDIFSVTSTTDTLLGLLGHSMECSKLAKAGRIVSCACRTTPLDDPAVAVGLTMHFARTAMARGIPMPNSIISLLESRIHEGDPACRIVGQWLHERGLLGNICSPTKGDA